MPVTPPMSCTGCAGDTAPLPAAASSETLTTEAILLGGLVLIALLSLMVACYG